MADRILPTDVRGWSTLIGTAFLLVTTSVASIFGSYVWLVATIEHVHDTAMVVEHDRSELLADITLLDKQLESLEDGPLRDETLARRVSKYADLDLLNGG